MRRTVLGEDRVTQAIVLVNDPVVNRRFDLAAAVGRARRVRLALVVEPAPAEAAGIHSAPSGDGDALAAACAATFGAPVAPGRFFLHLPGRPSGSATGLFAAEAVAALVQQAGPAAVVVGVVSLQTLPLWEALHADPRTQGAPKIGITSPRLDLNWNLAQKLLADGKLQLHEHSSTLERTLGRRIDTLLAGHVNRGVPGAAGG